MKIQNFSAPQNSAQLVRPQANNENQPPQPNESFDSSKNEDPGLMPKPPQQPEEMNAIAAGALYGGLAGGGIAVALGCMTMGAGVIVGFATVPLGIALGAGIGSVVELFK